jgi:uncharacterized lipoprotein YajG
MNTLSEKHEMLKTRLILYLTIILIAGCQSTLPEKNNCDSFRPIYISPQDNKVISERLKLDLEKHWATGHELCGWPKAG